MAEYKIKDLEVLSGVKAHTIRIWEKRYNLLSPDRTETQIRLYTDEDLVILLNVCLLYKHGVKISHIANMSFSQIQEKVLEIQQSFDVGDSSEQLILALLTLDEALFRNTLGSLISEVGLIKTFLDHLIPFLDRIGIMWLVGTINPSQEHFISNLIRQKIIAEIDKMPIPVNTDSPVMLFLPEHEWHEISLLFYQFILREKQLHTVYLGQSLPYDSLVECIRQLKPCALVTSWLTAVEDNFIENYFKQLKEEAGEIPILAGGYQIKANSSRISQWIVEIDNVESLNTHFS
jgi:DNA-binding transcriptional MerR regulator